MTFTLDPRLAADSFPLARLELCEVRLMNNALYPWLMLVPERGGLREVIDLSQEERPILWREIEAVSEAMKRFDPAAKLNIGMIGNLVPQLHVHVVARREGDAAWPGPVWGGPREVYSPPAAKERIERFRTLLPAAPTPASQPA